MRARRGAWLPHHEPVGGPTHSLHHVSHLKAVAATPSPKRASTLRAAHESGRAARASARRGEHLKRTAGFDYEAGKSSTGLKAFFFVGPCWTLVGWFLAWRSPCNHAGRVDEHRRERNVRAGFDRLFALIGSWLVCLKVDPHALGDTKRQWRRILTHGLTKPWPGGHRIPRAHPQPY